MEVVRDGLQRRAATGHAFEQTKFLRLLLVELEEDAKRCNDDHLNDSKGTDCPGPSRVGDEGFRSI